ncbi:DMT family transporter [Corynebacterium sp. A21]|uniref:DMT family transporter n=1 Tax=Corynebacterium sp. A21 TaxID=3457318 RepID=UPI003FD1DE5E
MLAVLFGIFSGALMPVQTSVNTRLRKSVGTPLLASLISFMVGTLALFLATLLTSGQPLPDFAATSGEPWWIFSGGVLGVVMLTGNILLFPRVGSVQTVILPLAGQVVMGLVIDSFGLFHSPHLSFNGTRLLGAIAVLVGALLVVGAFRRGHSRAVAPAATGAWLWRLLGLIMGACAASQTAVNGRLGSILGAPVEAAFISFAVGTMTLLLLVLLARTPWRGVPVPAGETHNPWWMWTGGLLGATLVFANAFLSPILGTGLTVVVALLGMMAASLLIDTFGLIEGQRRRVRPPQVLGLLVIIVGVVLIRLV